MAVVSDSLIYDLAIAVIFVFFCLYLFFTSTFNYWKDRGVPYLKPLPFFGNLKEQVFKEKSITEMYQSFYDEMKGQKFCGFFEIKAPILMIRDPELVERVLIKDFDHFYNRGFPADEKHDPLSANLFNLENNQWRNLRYKLTPTFTTGKLKGMFEQLCKCGGRLINCIEEESKINKSIESKSLLTSFGLEVIGSVAFGLQLDKYNEASQNFRRVLDVLVRPNKMQLLRFFALLFAPKFAKMIGFKQFPQDLENVIMKLVRDTLQYRKDNNVIRNDFLQLLLNLQKQEKEGKLQFDKDMYHDPEDDVIDQMKYVSKVEENEEESSEELKAFMSEAVIASQCFIFLTAGSESVSTTMNFALYSLARTPKVQEKVHEEIDSVLANHNNEWSYQAVKEMVYLEQVIQETLRIYPAAPFLFRRCTKSYKMPGSDLVVEKGTRVILPIMAIQNDPLYYENPEVFDPDRFQDNNFKPSDKYLPFGDEPRICIAMRFAVLEVKVALARIMAEYNIKLSSSPLVYKKIALLLMNIDEFFFQFDRRGKA